MIHVLSILYYPVYGGPHNRNSRLAPILARNGVKTTALMPDDAIDAAERVRKAGLDVVMLPLTRARATKNVGVHLKYLFGFPGQVRAIRKLVRELKIDVVQINGLVNAHGAIAARAIGVPVVWQVLDTYTPVFMRKLLAPVMRRYGSVVMSTGQQVADEHPGIVDSPDRLITFFPPVDVQQFSPDPEVRLAVRNELGWGPSDFVVGTLGNINLQKGHDNFIRAAAALKAKVPNAKFLLLGSQPANLREYLDGLWKLAADLGLEVGRDLIPIDPAGRVHRLLQAMDVFWMTPRPLSEGIPTSMEEAMAVGLPVVSFNVGSIGELVENGRTGYLVADQDPAAVADLTVRHMLDAESRARMGEAGRRFIEANASLEKCAETHIRAYELALRLEASRRPRGSARASGTIGSEQ